MTALVESLTVEALSAFEQVEEFGIGGMLRVGIGIYHHWLVGLLLMLLYYGPGDIGNRVCASDSTTICASRPRGNRWGPRSPVPRNGAQRLLEYDLGPIALVEQVDCMVVLCTY